MADISYMMPSDFMGFVRQGQGPAGKIDPRVVEIYNSLYKYARSDARQDWLKQRKECKEAAFENKFFTDEEEKQIKDHYQQPSIINRLVNGVQGSSAVATSSRPDIKVFPLRDSDPYLAELCSNAVEHVWLKNYGDDVVYDMVEEKNVGGLGGIYAKIDENRGPFGAITFEEEEVDLWYWDARSRKRDRSDTHLIKAQLRSIQYIKTMYDLPLDKIVSIDGDFTDEPTEVPDTSTGEDNYQRGEKSGMGYSAPEEGKEQRVWEIEAYMVRTEKEHWAVVLHEDSVFVVRIGGVTSKREALDAIEQLKADGIPMETDSSGQITRVIPEDIQYWPRILNNRYKIIVAGVEIINQPDVDRDDPDAEVDEVLNPLGLDSDGDPVLPVVFYFGQRTSKAYYRGPTFYAFDPNKSLCKHKAQYTLAISKNLSAPLARDISSVWAKPESPDSPNNELLLNKGDRDPQRLNPGAIDFGALTNDMLEDKNNIDDAYGIPEVLRGKVPQNLERMSGRLGLALQDMGTMMQNPSIRGLESCITRLGKLILSMILRSWPRHKWESLVTEDRIKEFIPVGDEMARVAEEDKGDEQRREELEIRRMKWQSAINKVVTGGISIVDFNIAVGAGSSLPTNRLLRQEEALEYYKAGLFDRRAALEHSDHPNAKEVARRIDEREMQLAQMGASRK